jgi:hypothetical protein
MQSASLEWTKTIGSFLLSWPVIILMIALIFRKPLLRLLERFTSSDEGRAEIGPIKIELGKLVREGQDAVNNLNRLNVLMAESRLLELEITEGTFGPMFSDEQHARMKQQIDELRQLTASEQALDKNAAPNNSFNRSAG